MHLEVGGIGGRGGACGRLFWNSLEEDIVPPWAEIISSYEPPAMDAGDWAYWAVLQTQLPDFNYALFFTNYCERAEGPKVSYKKDLEDVSVFPFLCLLTIKCSFQMILLSALPHALFPSFPPSLRWWLWEPKPGRVRGRVAVWLGPVASDAGSFPHCVFARCHFLCVCDMKRLEKLLCVVLCNPCEAESWVSYISFETACLDTLE